MKQEAIYHAFIQRIQTDSLSHAYLFEGPVGTGKAETARAIAQALFCERLSEAGACGTCLSCQRASRGELPDLAWIAPEGQTIKVEQVRQLKADLSRSAMEMSTTVYIIEQVEKMTVSAANSLLTTLEEPKGRVLILLLTTNKEAVLPTIRSRCQIVYFAPQDDQQFIKQLQDEGIHAHTSAVLAHLTQTVADAQALYGSEWFEDLQQDAWQFFEGLVAKPQQAFVTVQLRLSRYFSDREQVAILYQLLQCFSRDLLHVRYHQQVALPHLTTKYEQLMTKQSSVEALALVERILQVERALRMNISPQVAFEALTISKQEA